MGNSLHCEVCGRPATVHIAKVTGDQVAKRELCEACAKEAGFRVPTLFSPAGVLALFMAVLGKVRRRGRRA